MKTIAIIPARSGSKGLPGKNIRNLSGKPLIAYSIETALKTKSIDEVYVSTDSIEIANIAKSYQAMVPILRPKELSKDESRDEDFINHWLNYLDSLNREMPKLIVQLRPTSPLRNVEEVEKGITMMKENKEATSLRCLSIPTNNPYKMWRLEEGSSIITPIINCPEIKEPYNAPRQSLPKVYWQNGYMDIKKMIN